MIGGDIVSAGYYKLSDKTKEDFFQEDGRQWFRTGDIGEAHQDGSIKIIGTFGKKKYIDCKATFFTSVIRL